VRVHFNGAARLAGSGRTGSFPAEAQPQGAATARDGVAVRSVPTAIVVIHKIQLRRLSAWLVSLGFLPTLKIAYLIKDHYSRIFRFCRAAAEDAGIAG